MTWTYFIKDHCELFSIFTSFFNETRNQFGKVIKILRCDNTKEYFSNFSAVLSSYGIAERKNKHLVELVNVSIDGSFKQRFRYNNNEI